MRTGLVIECKNPELYRPRGIEQGQMIIDLLDEMGVKKDDADLPIILHSFDYDTIKLWKTITDF